MNMRGRHLHSLLVAARGVFVIVLLTSSTAKAQTAESSQTTSPVKLTTVSSANMSVDDMHREEIRCTIYNQLTSAHCESSVRAQTSDDDDLSKGCAKLESFKDLIAVVGCTQGDYDTLHSVICTWDGKNKCVNYYRMQMDAIAEKERNASSTCNKAITKDVKSEDVSQYCTKLTNAKDSLISQQFCTASEISGLEKFVCCDREVCFLDIDTSTRRGQVELAIRRTSSTCSKSMLVGLQELSQPPDEACVALEATRPALIGDLICTEQDYVNLRKIVCVSEVNCSLHSTASACTTAAPDPFENEKEQRDRIQKVIAGELAEDCQSFMIGEAGKSVSDPLEKTCKNFLGNHGFIVIGGQCSQEDYDKLKFVICGSAKLSVNAFLLLTSCFLIFLQIVS